MDDLRIMLAILGALVAPFAMVVLLGIDRRLTARVQNRVGPPILQPLYDILKLASKRTMVVNKTQLVFATLYVSMAMVGVFLFLAGADLLIIFFVLSAAAAFYTLAGYAVLSPYSQVGATRELVQVLAYEPVVLMVFFGVFLATGSLGSGPYDEPLIYKLPLMFLAMLLVLLIKLKKSPYDVAEAHTEIVSGPEVEYSGPFLGLVKLGHWYEAFLFLAILSLFFGHPDVLVAAVGKVLLVLAALVVLVLIDNSSARLRYGQLARFVLLAGLALTAVNAGVLWSIDSGVIPWW
jgi:ech hydrogenase subunit B